MILTSAYQLEKSYAGRTLFENVSFGIEDNQRIGLVGPNGAGKTTLLKILAGEIESDGGSVSRKKGLRLGLMEQTPHFLPDATIMQTITEKCADEHERLSIAYTLMAQLDLNRFDEEQPVDQLSGGWKKRVALARELIMEPELLMLDEPTNHLDVSGILWLEEYLNSAPFSVLMITHDRLFLQRVVNHVLDLDPRNPNYLLSVRGDYLQYLEAKEHELKAQQRQEKVLKNTLRRETEWLRRGSIARQTKQSARKQSAYDLADTVDALKAKNQLKVADLNFGATEHSPQKLIEGKDLSKTYGDRTLFSGLSLLITPKTRLALLGDNGCGKSTLIKLLLGEEKPDTGSVYQADKLKISYFEQGRDNLDPTKSVLKNLCPDGDYVSFQGQYIHVRSYLDRFLFQGSKAELPVVKLSGGEQARLRLAQLMLQTAQVLVLDEPTNDLDAETLEVLEDSLRNFPGAVILVTHDRFFMDSVANQILAFPPPAAADRDLQKFASYFQWESWFAEVSQAAQRKPSAGAATAAPVKVKLSFKDKFELENMEPQILKLEKQIEALTGQAERAMDDHSKLADIHRQMASLQSELDGKYQRWADLEAKTKG